MKKLLILAIIALLHPVLAGACEQEEGIFAYVQNEKGKLPGTNVPAYKRAVTEEVFKKLIDAQGDFRMAKPKLVMNDGQLYVAWMNTKKGQIGLEESAYDICTSFGADSLNAMAALLAHELIHYYEKHNWTRHFSSANANTDAAAAMKKVEEGLSLEVQSDYLGGFLALSAGYNVYGLIPQLLPQIYKAYALPEEINGYPSLSDRIAFASNAMGRLEELQLAFDLANCLTAVEAYGLAASYYEYVLRDFQSREVFNNMGVLKTLAALQYFDKEEAPYLLPLELDLQSRMSTGMRGVEEDAQKRAALLEEAIAAFEQAEQLDKEYPTAWINKACAYLLQGAPEEASFWAAKAKKQSTKLGWTAEAEDAQVLLAVIAATTGKKEEADALLTPLSEKGSVLATLNKAILKGEDASAVAVLNFARGVERIDGLLLDDYLLNPNPDPQLDMGNDVFCGLQQFGHSKVLIHYAEGGKKYGLFHLTNEDYEGATRMDIRLGDTLEKVREKYTTSSRTVGSRQGTFLVYPKERILFHFDDAGKADRWIVYRLQLDEK